jgi:hypothetical protein
VSVGSYAPVGGTFFPRPANGSGSGSGSGSSGSCPSTRGTIRYSAAHWRPEIHVHDKAGGPTGLALTALGKGGWALGRCSLRYGGGGRAQCEWLRKSHNDEAIRGSWVGPPVFKSMVGAAELDKVSLLLAERRRVQATIGGGSRRMFGGVPSPDHAYQLSPSTPVFVVGLSGTAGREFGGLGGGRRWQAAVRRGRGRRCQPCCGQRHPAGAFMVAEGLWVGEEGAKTTTALLAFLRSFAALLLFGPLGTC